MASSKPMPPHTHPQNSNDTVIATAFKRSRLPTNCGAIKFSAKMWMAVSTPAISKNHQIVCHLVSASMNAGSQARTAPIYGTMFKTPETIPSRIG